MGASSVGKFTCLDQQLEGSPGEIRHATGRERLPQSVGGRGNARGKKREKEKPVLTGYAAFFLKRGKEVRPKKVRKKRVLYSDFLIFTAHANSGRGGGRKPGAASNWT